ncbi:MAG: DUF4136 domain-containing protein [Gammaproteobacteria bacterium]
MKPRFLSLFAVVVALAACATGPEVRSDYDPSVNFAQYRTYGFLPRDARGGDPGYSSLTDQRIREAIAGALEARGYQRSDNPDLLVNFSVTTKDIQEVRQVPTAMPPMGYYGWRDPFYTPWPAYTYETRVDNYVRGTLFVDLVDADRKKMVWEGIATGRVTEKVRENPAAAIDSVVAEIFSSYPFTAGRGAN